MPGKDKKEKCPEGKPLKEKEDYPGSIKHLVKKKLAADLDKGRGEGSLYLAQDIEDHLLTQGLSVKDLTHKQLENIAKELRRDA